MAPVRATVALTAVVLLAVGCRVDATTTVTVEDDGSGTVAVEVVLDREAVEEVDDLARQLRVDDLLAAGWEVTGPEPVPGGGRRILATKGFADTEQAERVLAEVTGPDGVLADVTVDRRDEFGRLEYGFSATLDLSGGIEAFGDDELTELLDGLPIGQNVEALEEELGAPLAELTSFAVVVGLPEGEVSTTGDPQVAEPEGRRVFRWEGTLGDPPRALEARTRQVDWLVLALAAVSVLAALILALVLLRRRVKRRRAT